MINIEYSEAVDLDKVVLLHGLMGTAFAHFGKQIHNWKDNYSLFPVDLPGHGACRVNAISNYFESVTEWLLRSLEKLGPSHVVAASYLGGTLAAHAARREPQYFKSLVLTGYVAEVPFKAFVQWASNFVLLVDTNSNLEVSYKRLHGARWRKTLEIITRDCEKSFMSNIFMRWDWIEEFSIPVLLVNGDLKENERMAALNYKNGQKALQGRLIKGAGHLVPYDRPQEFQAITEKFWKQV